MLAGHNTSDLAIASFDLNGGTLRDASLNDSVLSGAASNPQGSLTVDTTAPSAPTINLRDDSDTGRSITDNITSDSTPVITGTVEAFATVRVLDGATLLGTVMADANGNWSLTSPHLTDGGHALRARALDGAGNISQPSMPLALVIDTAAPPALSVSLADDTGASDSDGVTNNGTLSLTGIEAEVLVEYSTDGGISWSTGFTPDEGLNDIQVRQTDAAGNVSASTSFSFTLDTTPPLTPVITGITDDTGTPGDGLTWDNILTIRGTAEAGAIVSVFDGNTLLGTTTTNETGEWDFTTLPLGLGAYSLTARVPADVAGNEAVSATSHVSIIRHLIDLTSLSVSQGFIIQGDAEGDRAGQSVAAAATSTATASTT